jgi:hypothetical protein
MVGQIRYFFIHHITHMDYSGIEPGALLEYPSTKTLSQAANAVSRQSKDRTRFQEVIRLPLCAQAHFQKQTILFGIFGRQCGTRTRLFIKGQLRLSFSITLHIYLISGASK